MPWDILQNELRAVLTGVRESRRLAWSDITRLIPPDAPTRTQHGLWSFEKGENIRGIDAVVTAYAEAAGVDPKAVWAVAMVRWLGHVYGADLARIHAAALEDGELGEALSERRLSRFMH